MLRDFVHGLSELVPAFPARRLPVTATEQWRAPATATTTKTLI